MSNWSFDPDGARAEGLAEEIHRRLVKSLRYVFDVSQGELGLEYGAWLDALERGAAAKPVVHALFHDMVSALQSEDVARARTAAGAALALDPVEQPGPIRVLSLRDEDLGAPGAAALFSALADIEDINRLDLIAPSKETAARFAPLFANAWALIERNDPEQAAETRALIHNLVLMSQGAERRFTAGALSVFKTWGGLLINPDAQRSELELIGTLAHETTHLLLFALAMDEALVLNPPDQLYYSALRDEQRTMDGVYHATLVSARMTRAFLKQARAPGASEAFQREAVAQALMAADYFDKMIEVIDREGVLTPRGADILNAAREAQAKARAWLNAGVRVPEPA